MLRAFDYGRGEAPLALIIADDPPAAADAERAIDAGSVGVSWSQRLAARPSLGASTIAARSTDRRSKRKASRPICWPPRCRISPPCATGTSAHRRRAGGRSDRSDSDDIIRGSRRVAVRRRRVADRAAAFAVGLAGSSRDRVHDKTSDGESAQLRQLNDEVARISRVLARLSARKSGPAALPIARSSLACRRLPASTAFDERRRNPKIIRARRMRDQFFSEGLFEDPAWDMLLDLYAAEMEGAQVSVSSLCIAAAVAPTTALRWIARMTERRIVRAPARPVRSPPRFPDAERNSAAKDGPLFRGVAARRSRRTLIRLAPAAFSRHRRGRGRLAQLVEHLVYTERVGGSSPSSPTTAQVGETTAHSCRPPPSAGSAARRATRRGFAATDGAGSRRPG